MIVNSISQCHKRYDVTGRRIEDFPSVIYRTVLQTFFHVPKINWKRRPTPTASFRSFAPLPSSLLRCIWRLTRLDWQDGSKRKETTANLSCSKTFFLVNSLYTNNVIFFPAHSHRKLLKWRFHRVYAFKLKFDSGKRPLVAFW